MPEYFRYLDKNIDELQKSLDNLKSALEEAIQLRNFYSAAYMSASNELYDNVRFERLVLRDAIIEANWDVLNIFEDEVNAALERSKEFDFPEFQTAFKGALWDNDKFIEFYMPSEETLGVKINLESLGTLEDYVNGVKYARAILGAEAAEREAARMAVPTTSKNPKRKKRSAPKMTPERASVYWKDYVYRGGSGGEKHSRTIDLRLKDFANKAPFWHILEDGTPLNLSSDWTPKGFPTPQTKPTRFVEKAAARITKFIRSKSKEIIERITARLEAAMTDYANNEAKLNHDIRLLRELIANWGRGGGVPPIEKARTEFEKRLEKQREQGARIEKINELFTRIAAGEKVSDRVYLGYGQRKRTTRLVREINRILGRG